MDMDPRTKARHMQAVRTMVHLLEGHISQLPKGKSYLDVILDGAKSATILGIEKVSVEERAKATAEAVARLVPSKVLNPVSPAHAPQPAVVGRGIAALFERVPPTKPCGIELSCPRGDQ